MCETALIHCRNCVLTASDNVLTASDGGQIVILSRFDKLVLLSL